MQDQINELRSELLRLNRSLAQQEDQTAMIRRHLDLNNKGQTVQKQHYDTDFVVRSIKTS